MKRIKVSRMHICDERWLLGNPIVEVDIYGKGGYKNIINQLSNADYDVITLPEYNKKIVKYAGKKNIVVEAEDEYLPIYFEGKFKKRFEDFGPLDLAFKSLSIVFGTPITGKPSLEKSLPEVRVPSPPITNRQSTP